MKRWFKLSMVGLVIAACISVGLVACSKPGNDNAGNDPGNNSGGSEVHTHTLTHVIEVGATCEKDGNEEYWHCSSCEKNFSDSSGVTEISNIVKPALGHVWNEGNVVKQSSCTEQGEKKYACTRSGCTGEKIEKLNYAHEFSNGKCTLCGALNNIGSEGLKFELLSIGNQYAVTGIGTCTDTDVIIPCYYNGYPVTAIGSKAFYKLTSLKSVTIPEKVTKIGTSAFSGSTNINKINYNAIACTSVNDYAFNKVGYDTSGVTLRIQKDVKSLPARMFYTNTIDATAANIKNVIFEEGCKCNKIGDYAFYNCNGIEKLYIYDVADWCNITFGNESSTPMYYAKGMYVDDELLTELVIPDGVTDVMPYAFYKCRSIEKLTIGKDVIALGSHSFSGCRGITTIDYNAVECKLTGDYVFHKVGIDTTGVTVNFGNRVKSIPGMLFGENYIDYTSPNIRKIVFKEESRCEKIGEYAFRNLTTLVEFQYGGTMQSWDEVKKGTYWNYNTGKYEVKCTNGTCSK